MGANSAAILANGGFSIAFDWNENGAASGDWFAVRVGSGGENSGVNHGGVDLGFLIRAEGSASTFNNTAETAFANTDATTNNQVELRYAFDSWDAGTDVALTTFLNGNELGTDTFTWNTTDDMRIVFGTRYNDGLVDNITISTLSRMSSPSAVLTFTNSNGNVLVGAGDMDAAATYTLQGIESLTSTNSSWMDLAFTTGVAFVEWEIPATNNVFFMRVVVE